MNVQITKTKAKGSDVGLFPIGFKVSGALVDANGVELIDPLSVPKDGIFLRLETTAFGDFPYQFATDGVLTVTRVQQGKYNVETLSAIWLLAII